MAHKTPPDIGQGTPRVERERNKVFFDLRTFSFSEKDNITFSLNLRKSVDAKKLQGSFSNYKKKYLCY